MFGKRKAPEEEVTAVKAAVADEKPDLEVPMAPQNAGMPGFTEEAPAQEQPGIPGFGSISTAPEPAKAPEPVQPKAKPLPTPAPEPTPAPAEEPAQAPGQYQVVGVELLQDGLLKYVVITNKNLGEVGGVYEA